MPSCLLRLDLYLLLPLPALPNLSDLTRIIPVLALKVPCPEESLGPRQTGTAGHPLCQDGWHISVQMPFLRTALSARQTRVAPHLHPPHSLLHYPVLFSPQHLSLAEIILLLLFTFLIPNSPHTNVSTLKTKAYYPVTQARYWINTG